MKSILKQVLTVVVLLSVPTVFAQEASRFSRAKTAVSTAAVNAKNAAKAQVFKHLWKKDSRLSVNVARTGVVLAAVVCAGVLTYKAVQKLRNYMRTPAAKAEQAKKAEAAKVEAKKDGMFTRLKNWMTAKPAAATAATANDALIAKLEQEKENAKAKAAAPALTAQQQEEAAYARTYAPAAAALEAHNAAARNKATRRR